jgi:hypothetical protein
MTHKTKEFELPLYGEVTTVCLTDNFKRSAGIILGKKFLSSQGDFFECDNLDGAFLQGDTGSAILLGADCSIGIIVHESFHFVESMLMSRGLLLTIDTSEAYAYAIGHCTSSIIEIVNELRLK